MDTHEFVVFPQDEAKYAAWVQNHPDGYVINVPKHSKKDDMLWHRADCGTITPGSHSNFIEGQDYFKACSTHAGALAVWAKEQPQNLRYCKFCSAKAANEQK